MTKIHSPDTYTNYQRLLDILANAERLGKEIDEMLKILSTPGNNREGNSLPLSQRLVLLQQHAQAFETLRKPYTGKHS